MEAVKLSAIKRAVDKKKVGKLRQKNLIPAVLYGNGIKNIHLSLDNLVFNKVYKDAGSSTLIDLSVDDKEAHKVLIQDVQFHPATDEVLHIDFYQVKMDEEITAEVEITFIGISPAVKDEGGVLVKNFDTIEVKCLPADLPSEIVIDTSKLATFDDVIKVKDLDISDKVEVMREPDRVIATVAPPRSEEELAKLDEEVEEDVEAVEGVKEDEGAEEDAEGEVAEEGAKPEDAKAEAEGEDKAPAEESPKKE
ncbi:50S ribosomal protein L25 [Patescibacteria group bacterium]